jgi:uncharacterized repeat protein (TIGR02543 family)
VIVAYYVASINVTATANHSEATVSVSDGTLSVGANTVTVTVTAEDGTPREYRLTVNRALPSNDANLSVLSVSPGDLTPAFDAGTPNYTVDVPNSATSIDVTATANHPEATVSISDRTLNVGANTVTVTVSAEDGTENVYTLTVNRASSDDANLKSLTVSSGILSPSFNPTTTGYTVNVPNSATSINVTATANHSAATVSVNGGTLNVGANTVTVTVTAENGTTKDYTLTVNRASSTASIDANLKSLTVSAGSLTPAFGANTTSYTVDVSSDVTSINVTGEANHSAATVSGNVSGRTLSAGDNVVTITVTAEDAATRKVYTVIIRVAAIVNAQTPVIGTQPQTATYNAGDAARALTVTATVGDGGTLSYQWYLNTSNSNTGGSAITGGTTASYSPPTANAGTAWYYVVVTNTNAGASGTKTASVTSSAVSVTVNLAQHAITYLLNGGTNHPDNPDRYTSASPKITLKAPSRNGYSFTGWTPADTIPSGSTGAKEFTAGWSAIDYSITYVLSGGENHVDNPATYTVDSLLINLQSPTRAGYEFAGWTEGATIAAGSTGDKTFTAEWTTSVYSITYVLNVGLNHADNPATYTVVDAVSLQSPTRTGYEFAGWTEGAEIAVGSTGDKTFTAEWTAISYSIAYELDGGVNHSDNPAVYTINDAVTLQSPTRTGYSFSGWLEGNSIAIGSTGDRTFTAQWKCAEANIEEIAINGVEISESASDNVFEYSVGECGESSITLDLDASSQANVTVNGKPYAPNMEIALEGYLTSVDVRIESESGDNIRNYTLSIAAPLNSSLYYRRWNDVIAVNRNPATNGGYNVSEVRWYRQDGSPAGNGEFIQLQSTESVNDYYSEVKIVETGAWHRVCATGTRSLDKIVAYPNPVPRGEKLTLQLPEQYAGSVLNIYSIKGALVKSGQPLPAMVNSVDLSEFVSGVYLLRISDKQGNSETVKIIIE